MSFNRKIIGNIYFFKKFQNFLYSFDEKLKKEIQYFPNQNENLKEGFYKIIEGENVNNAFCLEKVLIDFHCQMDEKEFLSLCEKYNYKIGYIKSYQIMGNEEHSYFLYNLENGNICYANTFHLYDIIFNNVFIYIHCKKMDENEMVGLYNHSTEGILSLLISPSAPIRNSGSIFKLSEEIVNSEYYISNKWNGLIDLDKFVNLDKNKLPEEIKSIL